MSNPPRIPMSVCGFDTAGPTAVRETMAKNNNVLAGALYYDFDDERMYVYSGFSWRLIGPTTPTTRPQI